MGARAAIALVAIAAVAAARAQDSVWVDVTDSNSGEEVEKRFTPELLEELQSARDNTVLLYTEFTGRAGADLKMFIRNISGLTNDTINRLSWGTLESAPEACHTQFKERLKKIEYDAHRGATFCAENHSKFFRGHMIVFRMHLNKSEDYIKKCENLIKVCGTKCETSSRVTRWRRMAKQELNRVFDDIQHSRKSYHDLLLHAHRKLTKLRKEVNFKVNEAITKLEHCAKDLNIT